MEKEKNSEKDNVLMEGLLVKREGKMSLKEKEKIFKKHNSAVNGLVDFVEGRMPFEEFEYNYKNDLNYFSILEIKDDLFERSVNKLIESDDWSTIGGKTEVHFRIEIFLKDMGVSVKPTSKYEDDANFIYGIQPSYVSTDDEDFLKTIIASAPQDLSKVQQRKWLKDKVKSLFLFDKSPPRWIQNPEWPIIDGKPLVFKKQTREKENDERIWYTFYDPDTKEETVIMQFY